VSLEPSGNAAARWSDGRQAARALELATWRGRPALAVLALLISFVWLYGPVVWRMSTQWAHDPDYSHGFIVPPLAAWFAWQRRRTLAVTPASPSWVGLVAIGASLVVFLAGVRGAELFLTRISMIGVIAGAILLIRGWRSLGVLAFPLAFLLLMIPLPAVVFNQVTMPLQLFASRVAERTLDLAAIPALREGNLVLLPHSTLEVVEACSGIRSIVSLLTIGIVFVQFTRLTRGRRVVIVLATIPLAVLANGLRVAATGIAAYRWGSGVTEGALHTLLGWLMFVLVFVVLLVLVRCLEPAHPSPAHGSVRPA
jgi:exosortase